MIYFNLELLLVKHQTFRSQVGNLPSVFLAPGFLVPPNQVNKFIFAHDSWSEKKTACNRITLLSADCPVRKTGFNYQRHGL